MDRPTKTARQLLETKRSAVTGVISVAPGDTVLSALKLMHEKDTGAVVVLEGGKLAGVVTERDYAQKVELQGKPANRDRGASHEAAPPTPPGIRVRTTAVRRIKRLPTFPWRGGPDGRSELW